MALYDYSLEVQYENSGQWRDGGTYPTYREAIANISRVAETYQYGFGDIVMSQLVPDDVWGEMWVPVLTIPR